MTPAQWSYAVLVVAPFILAVVAMDFVAYITMRKRQKIWTILLWQSFVGIGFFVGIALANWHPCVDANSKVTILIIRDKPLTEQDKEWRILKGNFTHKDFKNDRHFAAIFTQQMTEKKKSVSDTIKIQAKNFFKTKEMKAIIRRLNRDSSSDATVRLVIPSLLYDLLMKWG